MDGNRLGRLERVELRDYWQSEATDFTPWLATEANLGILSEAIGIDLELEAQERSVGALPGGPAHLKPLSEKRRLLYATHIHPIGFRLVGETCALLRTVQQVTISGYSQRVDRSSRHTSDEYLFSARVAGETFCAMSFDSLSSVDVVSAFERFELRCQLTKTGVRQIDRPFGRQPQ